MKKNVKSEKNFSKKFLINLFLSIATLNFGCAKAIQDAVNSASSVSRYLYIATGSCYVAGLTSESFSRRVSKVRLDNGVIDSTIADYNTAGSEYPTGLVNLDNDYMAVLVENSSGRRIDKVNKKRVIPNSDISTFIPSNAGLSSQLRAMIGTSDGGLVLSRSAALERFTSSKTRVIVGASNPFANLTLGTCAGSTTLITAMAALSNGKIAFAHAAASPANRMGVISSAGFNVAGDCVATAAPSASYYPTAMVYIPSLTTPNTGQMLVGYGPNAAATVGADAVITYDVNETTGAMTLVGDAFRDTNVLRGISAMAYDPSTLSVYVANGSTSQGNTIEKFFWNPVSKTMTRVGTSPYIGVNADTKCVTSMIVAN